MVTNGELPDGKRLERMLRAAGEYLESAGWTPIVISASRVNQVEKYRFELVLKFTGTKNTGDLSPRPIPPEIQSRQKAKAGRARAATRAKSTLGMK